ncbi:MAG: AAA family ATPase [Mycoplasma sp.]|nr:AAA family ATPase [Mycoplasma sp.]
MKLKIKTIELFNIGVHENLKLFLKDGINLIVGNNGVGKTTIVNSIAKTSFNVLESNLKYSEIISWGKDSGHIKLLNEDNGLNLFFDCFIDKEKTVFEINKKQINNHYESPFAIVMFTPEKFNKFIFESKTRRELFNKFIAITTPIYNFLLNDFKKILKQRNKLLKTNFDRLHLQVVTKKLIEIQIEISNHRKSFIDKMTKFINKMKIESFNEFSFEIEYKSFTNEFDNLKALYNKDIKMDSALGYTTRTINKDDFIIRKNEKNIYKFSSQGQKRSHYIYLLFLFLFTLVEKGFKPVLILDDALSELDELKKTRLIKLIPKGLQTIITTTKKDYLKQIKGFNTINL